MNIRIYERSTDVSCNYFTNLFTNLYDLIKHYFFEGFAVFSIYRIYTRPKVVINFPEVVIVFSKQVQVDLSRIRKS